MLSSLIILRQSSALRELETLGKRGLYDNIRGWSRSFGGGIDRPENRHIKDYKRYNVLMDLPQRSSQRAIPEADTEVSREKGKRKREKYMCICARFKLYELCFFWTWNAMEAQWDPCCVLIFLHDKPPFQTRDCSVGVEGGCTRPTEVPPDERTDV